MNPAEKIDLDFINKCFPSITWMNESVFKNFLETNFSFSKENIENFIQEIKENPDNSSCYLDNYYVFGNIRFC